MASSSSSSSSSSPPSSAAAAQPGLGPDAPGEGKDGCGGVGGVGHGDLGGVLDLLLGLPHRVLHGRHQLRHDRRDHRGVGLGDGREDLERTHLGLPLGGVAEGGGGPCTDEMKAQLLANTWDGADLFSTPITGVSFGLYIKKVLKQVHLYSGRHDFEYSITKQSIAVVDDMLHACLQTCARRAEELKRDVRPLFTKDEVPENGCLAASLFEDQGGENPDGIQAVAARGECILVIHPGIMTGPVSLEHRSILKRMGDRETDPRWVSASDAERCGLQGSPFGVTAEEKAAHFDAWLEKYRGERGDPHYHPDNISARHMQSSVSLSLPGELMSHAIMEGANKTTKARSVDTGGDGLKGSRAHQPSTEMAANGLVFPAATVGHLLAGITKQPISTGGAVFMTAVLEYLAAEILEVAGNAARDDINASPSSSSSSLSALSGKGGAADDTARPRITPRHILLAIRGDEELDRLFPGDIMGGGSVPWISPHLAMAGNSGGAGSSAGDGAYGGDGVGGVGGDLPFSENGRDYHGASPSGHDYEGAIFVSGDVVSEDGKAVDPRDPIQANENLTRHPWIHRNMPQRILSGKRFELSWMPLIMRGKAAVVKAQTGEKTNLRDLHVSYWAGGILDPAGVKEETAGAKAAVVAAGLSIPTVREQKLLEHQHLEETLGHTLGGITGKDELRLYARAGCIMVDSFVLRGDSCYQYTYSPNTPPGSPTLTGIGGVCGSLRHIATTFLENLIRDAVTIMEHDRRRIVLATDLRQSNDIHPMYGAGLIREMTHCGVSFHDGPGSFDWAAAVAKEQAGEDEVDGDNNDDHDNGTTNGSNAAAPATTVMEAYMASLDTIRREQRAFYPFIRFQVFSDIVAHICSVSGFSRTYDSVPQLRRRPAPMWEPRALKIAFEMLQAYLIRRIKQATTNALRAGRAVVKRGDFDLKVNSSTAGEGIEKVTGLKDKVRELEKTVRDLTSQEVTNMDTVAGLKNNVQELEKTVRELTSQEVINVDTDKVETMQAAVVDVVRKRSSKRNTGGAGGDGGGSSSSSSSSSGGGGGGESYLKVAKRVKTEKIRADTAENKAEDLEDKLLCTICMENERQVMYLPCNHFIACGQCPATASPAQCPFCSGNIEQSVRPFMN